MPVSRCPVKHLAHLRKVFAGDAAAIVFYRNLYAVLVGANVNPDFRVFAIAVPDRIGDDIAQDYLEPPPVAVERTLLLYAHVLLHILVRSEEHTSELQSREILVYRLWLET